MPKRFTPEQIAASAAIGELRTQQSFEGDTEAWHRGSNPIFATTADFFARAHGA